MDGDPRRGRRRRLPPVWAPGLHERPTGAVAIARRGRVTARPIIIIIIIIIITTTTSDDGKAIFTRSFDQDAVRAAVRAGAAADDGWCAPLTHVPTTADIEAKPPAFQLQEPYRTIS